MTAFLLLLCPTQASVELTTQYIAQTQPCSLHQSSCISLPNCGIVDWTNMPSLCVCMIVHPCGDQKSTLRCCSLVAICLFLYFFITLICMTVWETMPIRTAWCGSGVIHSSTVGFPAIEPRLPDLPASVLGLKAPICHCLPSFYLLWGRFLTPCAFSEEVAVTAFLALGSQVLASISTLKNRWVCLLRNLLSLFLIFSYFFNV